MSLCMINDTGQRKTSVISSRRYIWSP